MLRKEFLEKKITFCICSKENKRSEQHDSNSQLNALYLLASFVYKANRFIDNLRYQNPKHCLPHLNIYFRLTPVLAGGVLSGQYAS